MTNNISDIKENYMELMDILSNRYEEVNGFDFYRYIFPNNENKGEFNTDYSKPNAIYLYTDEESKESALKIRRKIMLNDTWEDDYMNYVECNPLTFCSGLTYRGRANRLENAQCMNAMIFDLDSVGYNEMMNVLLRIGKKPAIRTLPQPTFIVMSGTGLHFYYVFENPIDLYPNIKLQLKKLKYDLTFRIWDYKGTSQEKQIQYQPISQGFRMVGSVNNKYDLPIIAFKTGEKVSLSYLNDYAIEDENKVDLNKPFKPSKYTREEAKEKFPDWYQRVVVEGNKNANKWHIKRDLYNWWLRQKDKISGGHRYFYLMCMVIYAVKCDIPKNEVERDMEEVFDYLSEVEHSNPLTKEDLNSALEIYDRAYYNFTIDDIEKLTGIRIERNKRNYRTQKEHIKMMNYIRDNITHIDKDWREGNGRPLGSGTKEHIVKAWKVDNPDGKKIDCHRETGLDPKTIRKWW